MMTDDSPTPSGESATAEGRLQWDGSAGTAADYISALEANNARLRAENERLTAEREDHGPEGRNVTNAQHLAMRERALAAEARAARLEEALSPLLAACELAGDLGDLSVYVGVDLLNHARRALNPEGGERA